MQQNPVVILVAVAGLLLLTYWVTFTLGHSHAVGKRRQAWDALAVSVNAGGTADERAALARMDTCRTPAGPEVFDMNCIRNGYTALQDTGNKRVADMYDRMVHKVVDAGR